jgi:WhiB family redox-sensing transcriptional regulator
MEVTADNQPPRWLHEQGTDRQVAARLCRGCPVQPECLELELRMFGEQTVGVWGALGEDDRRALVPYWRRARLAVGDAEPLSLRDCAPGGGER